MMRIFISSVQKEFEQERAELGAFIAGDALLRRQFTTFIFERDIPAEDRRAHEAHGEAHEAYELLTPLELALLRSALKTAQNSGQLLATAGYKSRTGNFKRSMEKLLEANLLAMTLPDKPRSKNQKYRTTDKGSALLEKLQNKETHP